VLELMSLAPGGGKTHILYHLTAKAVLCKDHGGAHACVVIVDLDGKFSISRLASQIRHEISQASSSSSSANSHLDIDQVILAALDHVHILRPETLSSTTATVRSIPSYLFNARAHRSFDRELAFVALDSLSAFYWQNRSETEHADLLSSTTAGMRPVQQHPANYAQLAGATQSLMKALQCPIVITTRHQGPPKKPRNPGEQAPEPFSFRSPLPPPWGTLPVLRLVTNRVAVRKVAAFATLADAQREAQNRQAVVEQGRFECFVNEHGLEESTAAKMRALNTTLGFFVRGEGLTFVEAPAKGET
jgi:DNA-repair protein XRCC2